MSTSINSLGTIFPDRIMVPMRYVTTISLTSTLGVPVGQVFSGNSVFDPNQTGAGHQAYGFDQLGAVYALNLVTHSTCAAGPIMPASSTYPGQGVWRAGLQASSISSLFLSDIASWQETGDGVTRDGMIGANYANASQQSIMALKRSTAKMVGLTPTAVNTGREFSGSNGGDPPTQWFWKFYIQTYDQATTAAFSVKFVLTYYTMWYARIGSLASS